MLAFAQLTRRESLRDIETCLASFGSKPYHSGIRQPAARGTLADANEKRGWRIFAGFARVLIQQAATLYADEPSGLELQAAARVLDSTTIDPCPSLFPWATFRRCRAAIKLHTLRARMAELVIRPQEEAKEQLQQTNVSRQRIWGDQAAKSVPIIEGSAEVIFVHYSIALPPITGKRLLPRCMSKKWQLQRPTKKLGRWSTSDSGCKMLIRD